MGEYRAMEAIKQVAGFAEQLAAVAIVVGLALYYVRRIFERHGGLSDKDRKLIESVNGGLVEALSQLRHEVRTIREEQAYLRGQQTTQGDRLKNLEGRIDGTR